MAAGLYFREVFTQKYSTWSSEHRPYGQVVGKLKMLNLSLSGRARMEYRITSDEKKFRNRDMVTIKSGHSFSSLKLVPYLADEIFYDLEENELNKNRFYLGVKIKKFGFVKPAVYLMRQSSLKNDKWTYFDVLGLKFSF